MAIGTETKAKKAAASKKPKSSPSHPPFVEMIKDAIVSLKERTGSSQYAITKFIEEKHKQLPPNFRKLLLYYLKKSVAAGKLVKVKNSFKLPPTRSKASAPAATKKPAKVVAKVVSNPKPKVAAKPKQAAKPKAVATKKTAATSTKTSAKPKDAAKPKAKATAKPAKVAKTSGKASPGKKVVKAAKKASVKNVKKPKSVKSPVKKAPAKKAKN